MRDIIIYLQESDTWKIKLTIAINFISSKDDEKEHTMHSKGNHTHFCLIMMEIICLIYWFSRQDKKEKCFQYSVTVSLNYAEIKWNAENVSNIKPFINKHKWKGINYPSKQMIGKRLTKIIRPLLLVFCILKKKKYVHLIFQKLFWIVKKKILLMITNEEKKCWHYLALKRLSALLRGIT